MPIVVSVDLKDSLRKYSQRWDELYKKLEDELTSVKKSHKNILSGPEIVAGDTIEILVNDAIPAIHTIHAVLSITSDVWIGIGIGPIDHYNKKNINKSTGIAFKLATEAITIAKKKRKTIVVKTHENTTEKELKEAILIVTYTMLLTKLRKQTIVYTYENIWKNKAPREIARRHNKAQPTIINILKTAQVDALRELIQRIILK